MRILSLLPSATEIVYALELGDSLVGISHECNFPPEARTKPVLSTSTIGENLGSEEIHAAYNAHQHGSHSLYRIDDELLQQLKPDIILTQELCSVCAIPLAQVREAARILSGPCQILSLEPNTLHQVLDNIVAVGEVTGHAAKARDLVKQFEDRISSIASTASAAATRPRVFCMEWMSPVMAGGHWIPEMVRMAGGTDALGAEGQPSSAIEWERVVEFAPEVLVIMPCGCQIPRTLAEMDCLALRSEWYSLPAVRSGRVYVTDSPSYFSRPGPRIVNGLEILAEIIHPELFRNFIPEGAVVKLNWSPDKPIESQRMSECFSLAYGG
jgi:iron complex transport system substrate-binding protein